MALATEVQAWLDEMAAQGLSAEAVKALTSDLETKDGAQKYIRDSQLRQADYSRKLNEGQAALTAKEAEIARKDADVTALQTRLVGWKGDVDGRLRKAEDALAKAQAERLRIEQRMTTLRETGVVQEADVADLFTTGDPAPKPEAKPAYFTQEDFTRESAALARVYPKLSWEMGDLREEHRELFGKRLLNGQELIDRAVAEGKPLREIWANEYKVADRQQQLREDEIKARIDTARKEERTKVVSEMSLPGAMGGGGPRPNEGAPALHLGAKKPEAAAAAVPVAQRYQQPGGAALKAAQAWQEGKYKATQ